MTLSYDSAVSCVVAVWRKRLESYCAQQLQKLLVLATHLYSHIVRFLPVLQTTMSRQVVKQSRSNS